MKSNELNTKDLVLGDWVKVISNDHLKYVQIAEIYQNSILTKESEFESEEISIDSIKLIPLTPEILEKNGFFAKIYHDRVYKGEYILTNKSSVIIATIVWGENYCLVDIRGDVTRFGGSIQYVHELQHALRLCGIEKEIEL